jgi:hypothetical protein
MRQKMGIMIQKKRMMIKATSTQTRHMQQGLLQHVRHSIILTKRGGYSYLSLIWSEVIIKPSSEYFSATDGSSY